MYDIYQKVVISINCFVLSKSSGKKQTKSHTHKNANRTPPKKNKNNKPKTKPTKPYKNTNTNKTQAKHAGGRGLFCWYISVSSAFHGQKSHELMKVQMYLVLGLQKKQC